MYLTDLFSLVTVIVLLSPVVSVSVSVSVSPVVSEVPFVTALAQELPELVPVDLPKLKPIPRSPKEFPLFLDFDLLLKVLVVSVRLSLRVLEKLLLIPFDTALL